jgi:membrane protease YdiL (CAAX protease family)
MTATALRRLPARPASTGEWGILAAIAVALGAIVLARLLATRAGMDALAIGAGFGLALGALAVVAGSRRGAGSSFATARDAVTPAGRAVAPARDAVTPGGRAAALAAGLVVGLVLAVLPIVAPAVGGGTFVPGLGRPAAPLLPWAIVTLFVAATEEAIVRGVLLDRLGRRAGVGAAVVLTSAIFALMHVPLYGWHVVPLDLAVGFVLAGLRLSMRTLLAPIAAHAVADLATWWL